MTDNGRIYKGCNIENASYGLTNCAERTAIFKAVSEGQTNLTAIAVVADTEKPVAPCGACRQVIAEFKINKIILCNLKGDRREVSLAELLPFSFSNTDLTGVEK
ncbi:Cytidine deaminase [bioreactor metagenome]|uniref:cytidine deaminase n=1 Tax=bioreactor metagenome TaxID=1076179 RepID=A0A645AM72_9ZZZZ